MSVGTGVSAGEKRMPVHDVGDVGFNKLQYFAVPPRVHMDFTALYPKNGLHWTGVQSSPVHFFFFKAEFEK